MVFQKSLNMFVSFSKIFRLGNKIVFQENILESNSGSALFKILHTTVESGRRFFREHHRTVFEIAFFLSGHGTYKKIQNTTINKVMYSVLNPLYY